MLRTIRQSMRPPCFVLRGAQHPATLQPHLYARFNQMVDKQTMLQPCSGWWGSRACCGLRQTTAG